MRAGRILICIQKNLNLEEVCQNGMTASEFVAGLIHGLVREFPKASGRAIKEKYPLLELCSPQASYGQAYEKGVKYPVLDVSKKRIADKRTVI